MVDINNDDFNFEEYVIFFRERKHISQNFVNDKVNEEIDADEFDKLLEMQLNKLENNQVNDNNEKNNDFIYNNRLLIEEKIDNNEKIENNYLELPNIKRKYNKKEIFFNEEKREKTVRLPSKYKKTHLEVFVNNDDFDFEEYVILFRERIHISELFENQNNKEVEIDVDEFDKLLEMQLSQMESQKQQKTFNEEKNASKNEEENISGINNNTSEKFPRLSKKLSLCLFILLLIKRKF